MALVALAEALWNGAGPDSDTALSHLLSASGLEDNYAATLHLGRALVSHGKLAPSTLQAARARWPWSIDLAVLHVAQTGGSDAAVLELETRVRSQNRRFATLAWAYWSKGDAERALAVLKDLDPASESLQADREARAELTILCGKAPEPIQGAAGVRLSFLETWNTDGGAALARRFDLEGPALPALPALWSWLIEAFVVERDFDRAAQTLKRFSDLCSPTHPEVMAQTVRLALECEDLTKARATLSAQTHDRPPWGWSPRLHAQHLRCRIAEASASITPDFSQPRVHAEAALRLYPRDDALQALLLDLRALTEDWDTLASDIMSDMYEPGLASWHLVRLGLPARALARIESGVTARPTLNPGVAARLALRAVDACLRQGDLAQASDALSVTPRLWPQRADHAYWQSELALARRDPTAATAALAPVLQAGPTRMGLVLNAARAAFFAGQFDTALSWLDRFRQLKTAQLGARPADDLRDMIVHDAADATATGRTEGEAPGLAARRLALAPPSFFPVEHANIPRQIAHYWEGPRSQPVERGLRQWAALHPDFTQICFGAAEAVHWLNRYAPDLSALFQRQTQPATRADLFRIALIAHEGGVFADLDEYPRASITPWLHTARAVMVLEEGHGTVANNFLAALPDTPLFLRLKDRIAARLAAVQKPYAWWDSGPAQVTLEAFAATRDPTEAAGLRFLSQAEYDARVSTNLPYPHKRGAAHWR